MSGVAREFNVYTSSVHEEKITHKWEICEKKISLHEIVKPHKCNICDAAFSRKRNIEIHISGVYEKKKPYKCLLCDGSFTLKDSLSKGLSMFNSRQIIFKKPIIEQSHFGSLWKEGASSKYSQNSSVTCASFEKYSKIDPIH